MLRAPDSYYTAKRFFSMSEEGLIIYRSSSMLKVKSHMDAEAKVIAHKTSLEHAGLNSELQHLLPLIYSHSSLQCKR